MLRALLLSPLVLLLCLPGLSLAQCPGVTTQQTPFAQEKLEVSTTAVSLTSSIYKPSGVTPSMAVISVEGGDIRYTLLGTPTPTFGHPVSGSPAQERLVCGLDSIAAFQAIQQLAPATLFVTYYRPKTP
jgi:hypothetical protein